MNIFAKILNLQICPPLEIREKYNLTNITRSTIFSLKLNKIISPHLKLWVAVARHNFK